VGVPLTVVIERAAELPRQNAVEERAGFVSLLRWGDEAGGLVQIPI